MGTAEIQILARLDNLDERLEKAITDAAKNAGDSAERELGEKFKKIGANMSKYVTLPVVAGFGLATKAASDLGEQVSKSNVVFGDSAKVVNEFAKNSAQDLGLSKRAALEAAGTYGNLFRAIGLASDKSAEMSTKLVGLAADLASFNNADPTEVLEALRAGLTGEAEPLKKFGININEARIAQEALNLGLSRGKEPLDSAAKAQAAYSLIMKDTTLAQGDFARTSGGLANQSRILKAELEDTAAQLGEKLIPFALGAAKAVSGMLDFFKEMPAAAQGTLLVVAGVLALIGPIASVVGAITTLRASLVAGSLAAKALDVGLKGIGLASGVAIVLGAVAFAASKLSTESKTSAKELAALQRELLKLGTSSVKVDKETAELVKNLGEGSPLLMGKNAGDAFNDIDTQLAELVRSGNPEAAKVALERIAEAGGTTVAALDKNKYVLNDYNTALEESKLATDKKAAADEAAAEKAKVNKDATQVSAEAYDALKKSIDATKLAMDRYLGVQLDSDEALDAFKAAQDDLTASIKENGNSFDVNTEKGRENRSSVRDLVTSVGELQRAEELSSGVALTDAQRKQRQIDLLNEYAKTTSPEARAEIQRYIDKIAAVPVSKTTQMSIDNANALQAVRDLEAALERAGNKVVRYGLDIQVRGKGGSIPVGKMAGGQVFAGENYIVNELKNGGEPFIGPMNGRILSNAESKVALAQSQSAGINLTFAPVIQGNFGGTEELIDELKRFVENDVTSALEAVVGHAGVRVAAA